jgi:cell division protein FtsW
MALASPSSHHDHRSLPALVGERRGLREAYFNRTFGIFLIVSLLTLAGLSVVYSASAAFAASSENRVRARRLAAAQAEEEVGRLATAQTAEEWATSIDPVDTPSYHSASFLKRQAVGALLGFVALFFFYSIDYQTWRRWAPWLFGAAVLLCLAVWVPGLGVRVKGAARWVNLRILTVQPSEVAKLALVLMLARSLTLHQKSVRSFRRGLVPHTALLAVLAALVLKEPDLGATACLGIIALTMFWIGGMRGVHVGGLLLLALAVVGVELMVPYRRARLLAFLDPEAYAHTHAWQLNQALIAMGSGGIDGLGLGAGPQKYLFLSEAYNDFIFAIIGEELGIIGALSLAFLFLALVMMGWKTAMRAPDLNGALVAAGVTAMFGVSAGIHMFVNTGLMPTKGLNLPFISYGSSSLIVNLAAAGILLNVSKQSEIHWASLPPGAELEGGEGDHRGGGLGAEHGGAARGGSREVAIRRSGARHTVSLDD